MATEKAAAVQRIDVSASAIFGGNDAGVVSAQVEAGAPAQIDVPFLSRWTGQSPPVVVLTAANATAADTPVWVEVVYEGETATGFRLHIPAVVTAGEASWAYLTRPQG